MSKTKMLAAGISLAVLMVAPVGVTSAVAEELAVYAWSGELPDAIVKDFEKETGITVRFDTFDSNESLIAKLSAGGSGYDVVNPSQYAVQILAKKGLIVDLDHAKIPNLEGLSPSFKTVSYDPGNKVSVPYVWGTTGLAYNTDCVKEPITSWKAMWDPQYKGRIYMLDNMLAAYIAGLQVNGFKANSTSQAEIEKATQSLIEQKPLLGGYNSTNFADLVSSGEACIVEAWSGNVLQAIKDNPKVKYVLPSEGGTMWVDGYAVAKDAPNPDAAYKFLNYLLRPDVAAKTTELAQLATSVEASKEKLPADIVKNTAIFPPPESLAKADFILDLGPATKFYQDGWTKVKAAP